LEYPKVDELFLTRLVAVDVKLRCGEIIGCFSENELKHAKKMDPLRKKIPGKKVCGQNTLFLTQLGCVSY